MTKVLLRFVNGMEWFNQRLGKGTAYLIWGLTGLLLFEAISRSVFNTPHNWLQEITSYIFWAYIFLAGAYVYLHEGHVRMDALYLKWSPRGRAIADAATFSIAAFYLVGMAWRATYWTIASLQMGEVTPSAAATYVWPIRTIMVIGISLVFLEALAFFIKDIYLITRRKALA